MATPASPYETAFLIAVSFAFGLATGSFLNVVIYRVPRGMSVIRPGSMCPSCGVPIRPYDNVPIVSWILLKGRCRNCRSSISPRYILIEAATALAFGAVVWSGGPSPRCVPLLLLSACAIAAASVSADGFTVPRSLWIPAVVSALALAAFPVQGYAFATFLWAAGGAVVAVAISAIFRRSITSSQSRISSREPTNRPDIYHLPELLVVLSLGWSVGWTWDTGSALLSVWLMVYALLSCLLVRHNKVSGASATNVKSISCGPAKLPAWPALYLWAVTAGSLALIVVGPHLNHAQG